MRPYLQIAVIVLQTLHLLLGVFWLPVRRTIRTGKLLINALILWSLLILWAAVWMVILPMIAAAYDKSLARLFPEAIAMAPILLLGWLGALIVCSGFYNPHKVRNHSEEQSQ